MDDNSTSGLLSFEGRQLKSFAEPINAADLTPNGVYFQLNFADEKLLVPHLQPVVFIGTNLDPQDEGTILYFQDIDSYKAGIRHDDGQQSEGAVFQRGSEREFAYIFEYERALDELMKCSLRRRNRHS